MDRKWDGQTVAVLASGPSLTQQQLHAVSAARKAGKCKAVAVNATALALAHFDMVYAGDFLFWKHYIARIRQAQPNAELWTVDRNAAERFQLNHIKGVNQPGLGAGNHIRLGGNSGYQAINLAVLLGAAKVLLLGFDMHAPAGRKHWHDDHPHPMTQNQCFEEWLHKFEKLATDLEGEGIEVLNCTPGSALDCFAFSSIEQELA
jgi:hypothetical protein